VILAISNPDDVHAPAVLEVLARMGERTAVLDQADLPRTVAVTIRRGLTEPGATFTGLPGGPDPLRAEELTAIWWRRPLPFAPHAELSPADAVFAAEQVQSAVSGIWGSVRAAWMNEPWLDERANHKVAQLTVAVECGLDVPPTVITSVPGEARAFLDELEGRPVVHKPLRATRETWRSTRLLGPKDRARLDDLRFGPAILQAYVPGVDIRVTAAGGRLLATAIDARETSSPHDFRPVYAQARVAPYALPPAVAAGLRRYLDAFGLRYAAVDLRLDAEGRLSFLEANPAGQWLFLEDRTAQPITGAVAEALAEASRQVTAGEAWRQPGWQGTSGWRIGA